MRYSLIAWGALCASACATFAETHPAGIPALSSRPGGAPYTIYLDFGGFSFTGVWLNGATPGVTPAYDNAAGSFTAQEQANIANVWARVAEKYAPFNINVTTVDPALAAGRAGSDADRQAFYDGTAQMMHTVIGGSGTWNGSGGSTGVSAIRTDQNAYSPASNGGAGAGFHTNFVFAALAPTNFQVIGEAAAHENGHGLGMSHQVDVSGGALVNAYASNFGAVGNGSYAPVMGMSFSSQRGTWRVGTSDRSGWAIQNDARTILVNVNMGGPVDDGVGHSTASATPLPLSGASVDPAGARGIIVPASATNPTPIGVSNYVTDYFWFRTDGGGPITLAAVDGGSRLAPGVADPGATLRSTLRILDASMNVVATATMSGSTLSEAYAGTLPAGRYFAEVASAGGYTSAGDPSATYFDMGSYFLTGAGFSAAKWTAGASGGDWASAANWLGNVAPQSTEDVTIPAGASVTHLAGSDAIRGLTNAGNLSVTGGALDAQSFTQTSGSTVVTGADFNVAGAVDVQGGSVLVGAGAAFGAGSVVVHGGGLVLSGGLASGISSKIAGAPAGTVIVDAGGTLTLNYVRQGSLTSGGLVTVRPAREGGDTSFVGSLALTGAGTLDVADNRLVVAAGDADAVRLYLKSAYNDGAWNGPGLTSSVARGDSTGQFAIGYATAGQLGVSSWGGVAGLSGPEIITQLTYYGDANMDGVINADDYALTDRGMRLHLSGWVFGDFNYSGGVDAVDYWLLDRGYLLEQGATRSAAVVAMLADREAEFGSEYVGTLMASLPEPGGVGAIVMLAAVGGGWRRRVGRSGKEITPGISGSVAVPVSG